jgi:hypothetical protein
MSSCYVRPEYGGSLAGWYTWSGGEESNKMACGGRFYLSGAKTNYTIKVFSDCRDAGSREW